jgi:glycine C-acetyltransferase
VGEGRLAMEFSRELFQEGVFTPGIAFPTVAEGKARLRTIMTATHTKDQLSHSLDVFKKVGKKMGII